MHSTQPGHSAHAAHSAPGAREGPTPLFFEDLKVSVNFMTNFPFTLVKN